MRWVDHEGSRAVALWGLSHLSIFVMPPAKKPRRMIRAGRFVEAKKQRGPKSKT